MCYPNLDTFLLTPVTLKPTPMPKYGIFGNPHLFVLESRDSDTETRNFSPVYFNVSGSIDMVVVAQDEVCGGGEAVTPETWGRVLLGGTVARWHCVSMCGVLMYSSLPSASQRVLQ